MVTKGYSPTEGNGACPDDDHICIHAPSTMLYQLASLLTLMMGEGLGRQWTV
jgi:hypothetical protein